MKNRNKFNAISIERTTIDSEDFFKISNSDLMRPFLMSIVSHSNHWMFISSNGGLTAGRKNSNLALFPYYTDDKITESTETTGSKSIFIVHEYHKSSLWEPFSNRGEKAYDVVRNLYKNIYGNSIIFEEVNEDLNLTYRYQWSLSDAFGFVKKSTLRNDAKNSVKISILDGVQNILPYGVGSALQNQSSNLVDAYKRNELERETGLGIYALSSIITDKAEPSEALRANTVWSLGLEPQNYLVSSLQLKNFRNGILLQEEVDIKAEKGAYFINKDISLPPKSEKEWMIIADVAQTHSHIAEIAHRIRRGDQLAMSVKQDIAVGTRRLIELNAASDGLQLTADNYRDSRHFANSLFNIMRGGIFDHNYQIEKWDFSNYLSKANSVVYRASQHIINELPEVFALSNLKELAYASEDKDLRRLCLEYMPLKFSRRHGDPSRPWNQFSINTRNDIDGSKILDYEGNWRDIFQNWEALAHSYPGFTESMIHKFLNATTFDGYNPYRVTKDGFDWETIEADNPWSYIGYWGDHQIIYLLKFLELIECQTPGALESLFHSELFVYANVPYRIKSYEGILKNPKDSIEFDYESDREIREKRSRVGADGALLEDADGFLHKVNFIEKILATVLAKISNFIPGAGIWMNTQRPEWNDANNALVGNGVSMVTLYYLRRFLIFFKELITSPVLKEVDVSAEIGSYFEKIVKILSQHQDLLSGKLDEKERKLIVDALGQAGSDYRSGIYERAFSGQKESIPVDDILRFVELSLKYLEHAIRANRRHDHLYHAYNLISIEEGGISVSHLSEMLEGQVAILSSGYLSSEEVLELLDALENSKLFREDQYSYLLYPTKQLPRFTDRNTIPKEAVVESELLTELVHKANIQIIEMDIEGEHHFNGNFRNAGDLLVALEALSREEYGQLIDKDKKLILQILEDVFDHKAFTGRSGTFYGYEGLGSIYWHMVSKLQLAVQECCIKAIEHEESEDQIVRLIQHYYAINEGIGVHKPPSLYGAFPTDPYSHTPAGKGAQQPGMTGQVKEDILIRFGELGVSVQNGQLYFKPCLLRKSEFLKEARLFEYVDVGLEQKQIQLEEDTLCFTYCQVPVIYKIAASSSLQLVYKDSISSKFKSLQLNQNESNRVFQRTGKIERIIVEIERSQLR